MAATCRLAQVFRDNCNFGGRRTNTLRLKQETLAPVSQTASNGISQSLTHTETVLSSNTDFKHSIHWTLSQFPVQFFVDTQVVFV